MNPHARTFGIIVRIGVAANLLLAIPGLLFPGALLSLMNLERPAPDIWIRFSAWLLILLSLFYLPAASAPLRSPLTSWLVVGSRFAGVLFFAVSFVLLRLDPAYLLFGLFDLAFGVPEAIFLRKALARGA